MWNDNVNDAWKVIAQLEHAQDRQAFQSAVRAAQEYMKHLDVNSQSIMELDRKAYYLSNEYSDKDTKARILEAKSRVIEHIKKTMDNCQRNDLLLNVLENYYLFLENLLERQPHGKGGIQKEQLEPLRIKNEYDVQHFLYAYLKPLYPMARMEVNEDTGYGIVRTDILLDSDQIIEVKCTRKGMSLKKLVEEIEADMVHYSAKNIYFFIYDKEKIIRDPFNFKKTYEEKMEGKQIHVIIHQPKVL